MWGMKCLVIPVTIGATGMVTKGLKKNVEARPGKRSVAADDSSTGETDRRTAVLVTTESETSACRNGPSSGIIYVMSCYKLLLSVLPEDGPFRPKHVDSTSVWCM